MPKSPDAGEPKQTGPSRIHNRDLIDEYMKYMKGEAARGRRPLRLVFNPETTSLSEAIRAARAKKPTLNFPS